MFSWHTRLLTNINMGSDVGLVNLKDLPPKEWTVSWWKVDEGVLWIKLCSSLPFWHIFHDMKIVFMCCYKEECAQTTSFTRIILCHPRQTHTLEQSLAGCLPKDFTALHVSASPCWKRVDIWRKTDIKYLVLLCIVTSHLKPVEPWRHRATRPKQCSEVISKTHWTHKSARHREFWLSYGFNNPLYAKGPHDIMCWLHRGMVSIPG